MGRDHGEELNFNEGWHPGGGFGAKRRQDVVYFKRQILAIRIGQSERVVLVGKSTRRLLK